MKGSIFALLLLITVLLCDAVPFRRNQQIHSRRAYGMVPDFSSLIRVYGKRSDPGYVDHLNTDPFELNQPSSFEI
uniref:Uncharacterized protein n=1 Tax=Panagrolaimus sp. JU765 TaxID=591449 RepID=A0AC34QKJ0_9BILA